MLKVGFDEYGECTGPTLHCDHCKKPISGTHLEQSSYFWKAPIVADEAENTIAVTLHDQCIQGYILDHDEHKEINVLVVWQGINILEQAKSDKAPIDTYYSRRGML